MKDSLQEHLTARSSHNTHCLQPSLGSRVKPQPGSRTGTTKAKTLVSFCTILLRHYQFTFIYFSQMGIAEKCRAQQLWACAVHGPTNLIYWDSMPPLTTEACDPTQRLTSYSENAPSTLPIIRRNRCSNANSLRRSSVGDAYVSELYARTNLNTTMWNRPLNNNRGVVPTPKWFKLVNVPLGKSFALAEVVASH